MNQFRRIKVWSFFDSWPVWVCCHLPSGSLLGRLKLAGNRTHLWPIWYQIWQESTFCWVPVDLWPSSDSSDAAELCAKASAYSPRYKLVQFHFYPIYFFFYFLITLCDLVTMLWCNYCWINGTIGNRMVMNALLDLYLYATYLFLTIGGTNWFGHFKQFFTVLLILFVGEIVAAVWLYQNPAEFRKLVEEKLLDGIRSKYDNDQVIRESFDLLQQKYKCCGVDGYQSWSKSEKNAKNVASGINYEVPKSCCSDPASNLCETTRNLGVVGLVGSSLSGVIYTEVPSIHFSRYITIVCLVTCKPGRFLNNS